MIWGHEASIGYFAQDHRSLIEGGTTVLEWLHQWNPAAVSEEIRGLLGQMLFARDEATKSTSVLSGGEAARLLFCKLMLQKPNVLVLDEPTNHLDLEAINALNISLQRYHGTVFLVTHDHDLIDEVAPRIWHFESDHKLTDFKGTYEEYQGAGGGEGGPRIPRSVRKNKVGGVGKVEGWVGLGWGGPVLGQCKSPGFPQDSTRHLRLGWRRKVGDNGVGEIFGGSHGAELG